MSSGSEETGPRLVTFRDAGGVRLGAVRRGRILDLPRAAALSGHQEHAEELRDMLALIGGGATALERVRALVASAPGEGELAWDAVEVLAPIPRPRKNIFCLGRNYAEHAAESLRAIGQEVQLPTVPNVFTKAPTSVTGPFADIPFDATVSQRMDWEVELAVIIGHGGRHIARADALAHIWGYTVLNDISARDIQNRPGVQWFLGKSLDGSCPMGPLILTADGVPDPQHLRLTLSVNGERKQDDTTAHMIFDIATIIVTLSQVLTLEPGDILATGTPSGVGFARTPPEFLKPGDLLESAIVGIGAMRNRVVDVRGHASA
ncbi:MAG: fumarylacetoacetate hydrolase family protein [Ktedonobacterales bacterium]|nr:fumarylacetoacetate hydrolase family protein [Ktedonobacterales bacterium]